MQAALTVDKWWKGVGETMRTSITGFLEKYPLLAKLARLTGDLPPEAAKNPVASLESTPNVGAAALQAQLDAAAGFTRPGPKLTAEEKAAARERAKEIQKAMGVDATGLGEIVLTDHGPAGPMVAPTVGVGKDGKMKGLGKVPEIIDKEFDALAKKLKQKGEFINGIIQNVAGMVGNAFGNAFQAAFEGGNFFAELGKGLLSGIGQMVMQLGEQMLTYGLIMAAGAPLLMMTPFAGQAMSAPAAIAAGIALTALGAGMGALGGKGGKGGGAGSGGGHGGAPSQQDNTFALQFDPDGKLRKASKGPSVIPSSRALTNSAMPDARPVVQIGTLNALHPDDPRWQREIASTVKNAQNRGLLKAS